MELIRGLHNLRSRHRGCVATIGNYDGVHLGHRAVLKALAGQSAQHKLPSLVMTFEPTSREFFAPDKAPPRILSLRERLEDLEDCGVDRVLCVRFDHEFASLSAEAFIRDILVDALGVGFLAVGDDFRFGCKQQGNFALLQEAGQQHGFVVETLSGFVVDGERVSSTRIRSALEKGDVGLASRLLGKPYRISGRVVSGQRLGRELGVPTANVPVPLRRAARYGVYVAMVGISGEKRRPAVINLGVRPTVNPTECLLEAHILDFRGDLYGQRIEVQLLKFLRPEVKFAGLDELRLQMQQDILDARQYFSENN